MQSIFVRIEGVLQGEVEMLIVCVDNASVHLGRVNNISIMISIFRTHWMFLLKLAWAHHRNYSLLFTWKCGLSVYVIHFGLQTIDSILADILHCYLTFVLLSRSIILIKKIMLIMLSLYPIFRCWLLVQ